MPSLLCALVSLCNRPPELRVEAVSDRCCSCVETMLMLSLAVRLSASPAASELAVMLMAPFSSIPALTVPLRAAATPAPITVWIGVHLLVIQLTGLSEDAICLKNWFLMRVVIDSTPPTSAPTTS